MIKNLYSISGLLPAQFRSDPASNGVGWTTINPVRVEHEYDCLECGDSGRSHPTLANHDGEICKFVKSDTAKSEINVGDFVQVNSDYDNSCLDSLVPGGIYMVREVDRVLDVKHSQGTSFGLGYSRFKSWINGEFIRKIDFEIGTRVRTIGAVILPGLVESYRVSGSGVVKAINKEEKAFGCIVHLDLIDDFWRFSEGQLTLDD